MEFKKIFFDKGIILTLFVYIGMTIGVYNYIPYQLSQNAYETAKLEGLIILNSLASTREFYNTEVIEKIINNHVKIDIGTDINKPNTIPYPATLLHYVSEHISNKNVTAKLYSEYPFKNRINTLTENEKKILATLKEYPNTTFYELQNDKIVIAKPDIMINKTCVECHNSHPQKNWDFDWEVGDVRGILKIDIPIDPTLQEHIDDTVFNILFMLFSVFVISISYYIYNSVKNKKKLEVQNKILKKEYSCTFKELNTTNVELEDSLVQIKNIFNKHIIFSKTDVFGRITEVSDIFCEICGYTKEELIGKPHNIIRHKDMSKEAFKDLWNTIEADKTWTGFVKNKTKTYGYYWVEAVVSPNMDIDGKKIGYISLRTLITDTHKIQELNKSLKND